MTNKEPRGKKVTKGLPQPRQTAPNLKRQVTNILSKIEGGMHELEHMLGTNGDSLFADWRSLEEKTRSICIIIWNSTCYQANGLKTEQYRRGWDAAMNQVRRELDEFYKNQFRESLFHPRGGPPMDGGLED